MLEYLKIMTEARNSKSLSRYCQALSEREHLLFEKARHLLRLAEIEAELEGDIHGVGPNEEEYNQQILQAVDEAGGLRHSLNQLESNLYGQTQEFSYIN